MIIEDGNATSGLNDEIILPDANNSLDINDESLGGASGDRSLSNDSLNSEVYPKDSNYGSRPAALPHPVIASQSAPQLKFAEDGSIIINEESLIIQRIEVEPQYDITVVEESENLDNLNYNSYRKFHHTKKWTKRGRILNSGFDSISNNNLKAPVHKANRNNTIVHYYVI